MSASSKCVICGGDMRRATLDDTKMGAVTASGVRIGDFDIYVCKSCGTMRGIFRRETSNDQKR